MSATGIGMLAVGAGLSPTRLVEAARAQATPAPADSSPSASQVYPPHGAKTASPNTEISFRGTSEESLQPIAIKGSKSGLHAFVSKPHADGRGFSLLADSPFQPGESVSVRANGPVAGRSDGKVTFRVARPAPTARPTAIDTSKEPGARRQSFRTRPDLQPPVIEVTTPATGTAPGFIVLGSKISNGEHGPLLIDNDGQVVWHQPAKDESWQVNNVLVQQHRGQPVLTWWEGVGPVGHGFGHYVLMDSSYRRLAEVQAANGYDGADAHEFVITPEGTALFTIYYPVAWDLSALGGHSHGVVLDGIVQEIEIETGRVIFEWHSLDHVGVRETVGKAPSSDAAYDYFHVNSAWKDEDGNYIVSGRLTSAIYKIDGRTGEIIWRLGGEKSDFTFKKDAKFAYQHDARVLPGDQLSLFDNASADADAGIAARGLVLQLDLDAMTAAVAQEYRLDPAVVATTQGSLQTLPNGNRFVGWGSAPDFTEFSADGTVLFNGRFASGANSYRAFRQEWRGQPETDPDVVAERNDQGGMTVFASWNGATEVASWRVLAGSSPDKLQTVTEAPRTGFETSIDLKSAAPYIAAQALDAAGKTVGTSRAVEATTIPQATPTA